MSHATDINEPPWRREAWAVDLQVVRALLRKYGNQQRGHRHIRQLQLVVKQLRALDAATPVDPEHISGLIQRLVDTCSSMDVLIRQTYYMPFLMTCFAVLSRCAYVLAMFLQDDMPAAAATMPGFCEWMRMPPPSVHQAGAAPASGDVLGDAAVPGFDLGVVVDDISVAGKRARDSVDDALGSEPAEKRQCLPAQDDEGCELGSEPARKRQRADAASMSKKSSNQEECKGREKQVKKKKNLKQIRQQMKKKAKVDVEGVQQQAAEPVTGLRRKASLPGASSLKSLVPPGIARARALAAAAAVTASMIKDQDKEMKKKMKKSEKKRRRTSLVLSSSSLTMAKAKTKISETDSKKKEKVKVKRAIDDIFAALDS